MVSDSHITDFVNIRSYNLFFISQMEKYECVEINMTIVFFFISKLYLEGKNN